jgi:hypothetical protein
MPFTATSHAAVRISAPAGAPASYPTTIAVLPDRELPIADDLGRMNERLYNFLYNQGIAVSNLESNSSGGTPTTLASLQAEINAIVAGSSLYFYGGSASGSSDAIIVTTTITESSLSVGELLYFIPSSSNATTTPTINVDGTGNANIVLLTGAAVQAGDIANGTLCGMVYTGTRWEIINPQVSNVVTSVNGASGAVTFPYVSTVNGSSGAVTVPLGLLAFSGGLTGLVTINDTVTPTTGGVTLAAQTAAAGAVWRVRAMGTFTAALSVTARNALIQAFWGATALPQIVLGAILVSTAQTTDWTAEFLITGSSATAVWTSGTALGEVASAAALAMAAAVPASTTVVSGAQTLDLRFSMSAAVAGDSWTVQNVTMERLN